MLYALCSMLKHVHGLPDFLNPVSYILAFNGLRITIHGGRAEALRYDGSRVTDHGLLVFLNPEPCILISVSGDNGKEEMR